MKFQEAMYLAQEMVTACENNPLVPQRLELNNENKTLIEELISLCDVLPYMNYRVLGEASSEKGFFEMSARIEKPGGTVVYVDFKNRKVLSRQAA